MNEDENKTARLRVETRALSEIYKPHPKWPGVLPARGSPEYETLRASLENSYFDGVIFNERNGFLVGGHKRVPVLIDLGFKFADVIIGDFDEPEHEAIMNASNAHIGSDDEGKLNALISSIRRSGIDPRLALLVDKPPKSSALRELIVKKPPALAWALVGVPIEEFSSVQALLDNLPASATVKTSVTNSNAPKEKKQITRILTQSLTCGANSCGVSRARAASMSAIASLAVKRSGRGFVRNSRLKNISRLI